MHGRYVRAAAIADGNVLGTWLTEDGRIELVFVNTDDHDTIAFAIDDIPAVVELLTDTYDMLPRERQS